MFKDFTSSTLDSNSLDRAYCLPVQSPEAAQEQYEL